MRTGNLGAVPLIVGEIAVVIVFGFTATNFFTSTNFVNLITQTAGTCMLAYGVVFVLLLGEIDLSIGYLAGIGALVVAELQLPGSSWQMNGLLAMLVAVAVCAVIGGVQGSIVAFVGVPSFVVTLAGFLIWQGVILNKLEQRGTIIIQDRWINYTDLYIFSPCGRVGDRRDLHRALPAQRALQEGRRPRHAHRPAELDVGHPEDHRHRHRGVRDGRDLRTTARSSGRPWGLPLPGLLMVLFFVLLTFLAKWTTFGRHVYAVGGNAEAARRAGINVPRVRVLVFALSGAMAAIGGIIFAAQVNSVALTFPPGNLLLNAIAAAVIGGVSLFGGRGEVRGALLGALLIGTLQNGLNTLSISNGWIYIVTGVVLLAAVTLDTVAVRLQARSGR